jgi:hypothetical protein
MDRKSSEIRLQATLIAMMGNTGEPIQTTALANLTLIAAQVTTGELTLISSVTPPKIPNISMLMNLNSETKIIAVQFATKLADVLNMTTRAYNLNA